jgi:hypothetical protein
MPTLVRDRGLILVSRETVHPSSPGFLAIAAAAGLVFFGASAAGANGAFPDELSVQFPATAPHRILLGTNFGLVISEDDGASWRYACEPYVTTGSSANLSSANVSFYQVTADGAFLADSINLTRSDDVGCTWPTSSGSVSGAVISDIFADPTDPTFVLAILATINGTSIVISHDGGRSFGSPSYSTPDLLTGIESSRSTPGVVYATAIHTTGSTTSVPVLLRSSDYGAHWSAPVTIPAPNGTQPRILAVDPADANTVYLRLLSGATDSIGIATDGQNVQTVLTIPGAFTSFLRAGDGTLYAGQLVGNLYVRPPGASAFVKQPGPRLRCLGQRPGTARIYGCGDLFLDGFSLGSSDDGGKTFQPVMKFSQILGPLTCAPVQTACSAHWDRVQQVLGISPDAGPPDAGTTPTPKGSSHCASLGTDVWGLLSLIAFSWRRGRS